MYNRLRFCAIAAFAAAVAGCTSNGNGTTSGIIDTGSGGLSNDGSTPTFVNLGGTATAPGTTISGNFICSEGVGSIEGIASTEVGSGGLVGGPLTTLLNGLGSTSLTSLLNSVHEPNNVIDGNLDTFATFDLTAGLFGGAIDSLDESVLLPAGQTVPAGKFAVFGVTFPSGTVDLSLLNSVAVTTFLNGTAQEGMVLDQNAITLLKGIGGSTPIAAFLGVQATKPYDTAQISLVPGVLTATVGDAMRVHELCIGGSFN